ncbi:GntR family transcriptional regulator [Paenibacillus sp. HB172176]|uniref:GntR family transcriptional regulator n=1 Tax=Paenibacillus sp. HB172176 TaxID=2493690 RepID=UPI00143B101F|nr:GntR family transcriptional regulator [Paenibacillus sp. HB172176]
MNYPYETGVQSAKDRVYSQLKDQILDLTLPPGTALSEKEMAVAFQVSRTPVRESFVRLAQEGLLQVLPQRGTLVSLIDTEHALEARFMREQLERAVIRLATEGFPEESSAELERNLAAQLTALEARDEHLMFELDEAFHRIIFAGCSKLNTWALLQQANTHLVRTRHLSLAPDRDWKHLYSQHRAIADAIRDSNPDLAERTIRDHLQLAVTDLNELKQKHPLYFK